MTHFILNQKEVLTDKPPGMLLLDFIRYHERLMGTKIGCREGDCGACTVLIGEVKEGKLHYTSATSCLMAIGNAHGKHIVTIEGINIEGLNAVQQAFTEEGATQCGFCTPGFIVSLTGFCMNGGDTYEKAIESINGNICRCTGYKSIERATARINNIMADRNSQQPLEFAIENKMIPAYFMQVADRLEKIQIFKKEKAAGETTRLLGGGTDLYVQRHESMPAEEIDFLYDRQDLKGITTTGNTCSMGGASTVTDISESPLFRENFPHLNRYMKLVSSTQIRNMATVGGNFTNASPIGDLTIFFLALEARLTLQEGSNQRQVNLKDFYKGYKVLDKTPREYIKTISFDWPGKSDLFNFEKVSKRTCLDIASVNSAILLQMDGDTIRKAALSAGGVGPIPTFLSQSSHFMAGKKVTAAVVNDLVAIARQEIAPISDARGTSEYKSLLLEQLIKAHFITLFPGITLTQLNKAST